MLRGDNAQPGTAIQYYLSDETDAGDVSLTVTDVATGEVFRDLEAHRSRGHQPGAVGSGGEHAGGRTLRRRRRVGGPQAPVAEPGVYRVTLTVDGEGFTQLVTVLEDVWMGEG